MSPVMISSSKSLLFLSIWAYSTDIFINLISCFFFIRKPRIISKCLLMPLLLFVYFQITNKDARSKFVIYGIIGGYIGDILLIYQHVYIFLVLGIFSFLLCQILYIIEITSRIEKKIWKEKIWTSLGLFIIFGCFCSYIYKYYMAEGCTSKNLQLPGIIYLTSSGFLNSMSFFYLINKMSLNGLMLVLGSTFFFVSDFILAMESLYDEPLLGVQSSFIIMLTYIIAQTCVVIGLSNKEKKHKVIRNL